MQISNLKNQIRLHEPHCKLRPSTGIKPVSILNKRIQRKDIENFSAPFYQNKNDQLIQMILFIQMFNSLILIYLFEIGFNVNSGYFLEKIESTDFLLKKRIFCKIYFNPIHLTEFYKSRIGSKEGDLPITEKISEQLLTLPLFPGMTMEEKSFLCDSIDEFFDTKI